MERQAMQPIPFDAGAPMPEWLSDAALQRLREQAPAGCLLCTLDESALEDWD
jgi:hypothetical protein